MNVLQIVLRTLRVTLISVLVAIFPVLPAHADSMYNISGTITAFGSGLAGVSVFATLPDQTVFDPPAFGPVTTDANGSYTLNVAPGTYNIYYNPPVPSGLYGVGKFGVTVDSDKTFDFHSLSTILRDENGVMISGAIVKAIGNNHTESAPVANFAKSDPKYMPGLYLLLVPPDVYHLAADVPSASSPYNITNATLPVGPANFIDTQYQLDLTTHDASQDLQIRTATFKVNIFDPDGSPVVGDAGGTLLSGDSGNTPFVPGSDTGQSFGDYSTPAQAADSGGGFIYRVPAGMQYQNCATYNSQATCTPFFTVNDGLVVNLQKLVAPSGLTAVTPVPTAPSLSWNPVAHAASYVMYRDGSQIATTTTPQYTDSSTTSSGVYSYTVRPIGPNGEIGPSSAALPIRVARYAPNVGTPVWSANPIATGASATLNVPVADGGSGISGGEYFMGDTDPGLGAGTPMNLNNSTLTATFAGFTPGVYKVNVRARDNYDTWSNLTPTMLVVVDPTTTLQMSGKNKKGFVPNLANGDILPGLTSANQIDPIDYGMTIQYKNNAIDKTSDFQLAYNTGQNCNSPHATNCHHFSINATSFDWLLVDSPSSSHGRAQGTAQVTVDGVTTSNIFTIEGVDGDRLSPAQDDYIAIKVFSPNTTPADNAVLYQVSGYLGKSASVTIK